VRTMIFEMGEYRSKEAPFWRDPFAAYKKTGEKEPIPIRPIAGKALWREFVGLFLSPKPQKETILRPRVLDQIADPDVSPAADWPTYPFRCVGVRTDMKAKVFEWLDAGFEVSPALLRDDDAVIHIASALQFTADCAAIIAGVFGAAFGGKFKKQERRQHLKTQMTGDYWSALAGPFREFILAMGATLPASTERLDKVQGWADTVVQAAKTAFQQAAANIGDDAASLRERVQGEQQCNFKLKIKRKIFEKGE
jgi:CRISPR system Cascade subunit CasA